MDGDDATEADAPHGEVRVWVADVPGEPALGEARALLDDDERAAASRFRADEHRNRFVWRRAMRRRVLGSCLGVPAGLLRFDTTCLRCGHPRHGKPSVVGYPSFHFSASQAGATTVVAVADTEVGVDIEAVSRDPSFLATVLSEEERRVLGPEAQPADLLAAWTRKEAYLKAIGAGLAVDLTTVVVVGRDLVIDDTGRAWELTTVPLDDCRLSVAAVPGSTVALLPYPA